MQRIFNGSTVIYIMSKKEKSDSTVGEYLNSEICMAKKLGYKPVVMISGDDSLEDNTEMLVSINKAEAARNEAAVCEDIAI